MAPEHLLKKYTADLESCFDESGADCPRRSPTWPPKPLVADDNTLSGWDLSPKKGWSAQHANKSAILERTRFLERGAKRKRGEVTIQDSGDFRFSHYDEPGTMPPMNKFKVGRGDSFKEVLPNPIHSRL